MATSVVTQSSLQVKIRGKCCIKSRGCSDTAVWRLFLVKIKMKPMWKCYCHWMKLISNSSCLSLALSLSQIPPLLATLTSFLPPPLTCITLYQSLPLSVAGVGERKGKPSGANGALFQGASGPGRLRQHQERCHTRADVSETDMISPSRSRSVFCLWCLLMIFWPNPKGGCVLVLRCSTLPFSLDWLINGGLTMSVQGYVVFFVIRYKCMICGLNWSA